MTAAVLIAALGATCDLTGEGITVLTLVEHALSVAGHGAAWNLADFLALERVATLLTAGVANALYTLGSAVLMIHTKPLPTPVRAAMCATWVAGIGMTLSAMFDHVDGMVLTTTILFPLLIAWTAWMAARWRPS